MHTVCAPYSLQTVSVSEDARFAVLLHLAKDSFGYRFSHGVIFRSRHAPFVGWALGNSVPWGSCARPLSLSLLSRICFGGPFCSTRLGKSALFNHKLRGQFGQGFLGIIFGFIDSYPTGLYKNCLITWPKNLRQRTFEMSKVASVKA